MLTLEVDINRILANIAVIKRTVNARIYAVVKADAYGHGVEICKYIDKEVYGFAVSCSHEASELVGLGIKNPILMMCPNRERIVPLPNNVIHTVCDFEDIKAARGLVAIKINSGMNRLGFAPHEFLRAVEAIRQKNLRLKEVFTHFYSVEGASEQIKVFEKAVEGVGGNIMKHCCASTCLKLDGRFHLDAVRCGLAIYGYCGNGEGLGLGLLPALAAYAQIGQINRVKSGEHVGYGEYVSKRDMLVAVIKAGYADGIRRHSGQKVVINGRVCDIVGNVCMDMCMADVSDVDAKPNDKAYFVNDILSADEVAKTNGGLAYEVLTGFSSKRINRVYKGGWRV